GLQCSKEGVAIRIILLIFLTFCCD
ncbi:hypothetical protein D039_0882B, partial [Vibrio parahaemolyticus EKP-028]